MTTLSWMDDLKTGLERHGQLVLATVANTIGSAPRHAGARMLVFPDGTSRGTVGGGILESGVIEDAKEFLRTGGGDSGQSTLFKKYILQPEGEAAIGSFCGGAAEVLLELFESAPKLVIFGAGHCGKALAQAATLLDFRIVLVDQRAELLAEVPGWGLARPAETFRLESPQGALPATDARSFLVIMTSSHDIDEQILRRVIRSEFAYVGMIASRNKSRLIREKMLAEGYSEAELARVHMPIGIAIASETPAEIAVSILAELVAERRRGGNKV